MKITDQLGELTKRVGALESVGFDDSSTIARITKIYGNVRISMKVTAWSHEYRKCGDSNPLYGSICGSDTYL